MIRRFNDNYNRDDLYSNDFRSDNEIVLEKIIQDLTIYMITINTLNIFHDSIFGEWERIIKFKLDLTFTVQIIENKCRKKLISKKIAEYVFTEPKFFSEISEPLIIKQGLLLGLTIIGKKVDFYMKSNSFRKKLTEIKIEMLRVVQCFTQDEMDCLFASGFPLFDTSMDKYNHLYDFYAIKYSFEISKNQKKN